MVIMMISKFKSSSLASQSIWSPDGKNSIPMRLKFNASQVLIAHPHLVANKKASSKIHEITSLFKHRKIQQSELRQTEDMQYKQPRSRLENNISKTAQQSQNSHTSKVHPSSSCNKNRMGHAMCNRPISNSRTFSRLNPEDKLLDRPSAKIVMPSLLIENHLCSQTRKFRQIYIKTAEGKKTKINTQFYFKKMEQKLDVIFMQNSNLKTQSSLCTDNSHQNDIPIKIKSKTILQSLVNRKKYQRSKEVINKAQFRPWSSCKSQIID